MQTIETSRGAVLTLGFMIARILHRQNDKVTAAADRMDAVMSDVTRSSSDVTSLGDKMDVVSSDLSDDSTLKSAISSAVSQLGYF